MKELIKSMAVWSIMLGISWSKNIPYDIELKVHEVFSTVQFVENKGIYNNEVLYFSTSRNVFVLKDGTIIANGIELKFGEPKEIKLDMLTPTGFSYFSNDKALNLETYARVVLKSVVVNHWVIRIERLYSIINQRVTNSCIYRDLENDKVFLTYLLNF
jgi:hypothetical protein